MPNKPKKDKKGEEELELTEEPNPRDEEILAAIQALRKDFTAQLQEVICSNHGIKEAINSFSERLSNAETRISSAEDRLNDLDATSTTSQRKMLALTKSVEVIENRQRRLNLRLVGLPENTEKGDLVSFLNEWLPNVLGPENFPNPLSIDQAFRLPIANKTPGRKPAPRTILVKFRWLIDRDRVMKIARKKKSLQVEGNRLMFFPDLSAEIQQQRKKFDGMKTQLHNLGIEFGIQFPAKMRIYHNGETLTFLTPAEVNGFIKKIETERSQQGENVD